MIRWDVVRWFLPAALPAAALGAWALTRFEPVYIKLALGVFLTANLPLLFLRSRVAPFRMTPRRSGLLPCFCWGLRWGWCRDLPALWAYCSTASISACACKRRNRGHPRHQ
jgi:uncharacterized membrane protein YfcA